MKYWVYIFAFYFFGLNFVLCKDVLAMDKVQTMTYLTTNSGDIPHPYDDCSPVCQCHCCHIHVVENHPLVLEDIHLDGFTEDFFYSDSMAWDYLNSVLDPPKV